MRIRRLATVMLALLALAATVTVLIATADHRGRAELTSTLRVDSLETEMRGNPLGIDTPNPRLGWTLSSSRRGERQTSYQIIVASSPARLRPGVHHLWDSGKVHSDATHDVRYAGPALASRTRYWWTVRSWDVQGQVTTFSAPAWFETAFLTASDWKAGWISSPAAGAEPLFRKDFTVAHRTVRQARLYLSGVGYAEATIDGRATADTVLEPGFTRYDKTVQYVTRDVTDLLRAGGHTLGVRLGRGFYGLTQPNSWNWSATPWTAEPRARGQLEITYADGSRQVVLTDGTWRTADGPVRYDSLYGGESYDARAEQPGWDKPGFDASHWKPAVSVPGPTGKLVAESQEPIRVTESLRPTAVTSPRPGAYVFALPRNIAGWARIRLRGTAGTKVTLRYGEKLDAGGNLVSSSVFVVGRFQTDEYTLAGRPQPEQWESRYTYKGFQYVEVTGWPGTPTVDDLDGRVVRSDVPSVGDWSSSQPLFNTVRELTRRTLLNNVHGVPTDTPMYEKNGWTGDAQLMAESNMFEFDMQRLYEKWLGDIGDSQGPNGVVPGIAPDNGWGLGDYGQSPPWNAAYVLMPWQMYQRYGDRNALTTHWAGIRRYVEHEIGRGVGGLHSSTLNDYLAPGAVGNSPEDPTLAGTAYAYTNIQTAALIADVLGQRADAARYRAEAVKIRDAFNAAFLRGDAYVTGTDLGYRQTNALLPLAFDMVPADRVDAVVARLVREIHAKGDHLDTGALGTRFLLTELTRRGYGDLAYRVATQRTYPSWGYWIDNGATSLWERWDLDARSRDHVFLGGAIDQWFFEDLAGIRPTAPGYSRFEVAPHPVGDLTRVDASTRTVLGLVKVDWQRGDDGLTLRVVVPVGATATVLVPAADADAVTEGGKRAVQADGVRLAAAAAGAAVGAAAGAGPVRFEVGSGDYTFRVAKGALR
jgi:alpha-L-rhamnosidase